MKLVELKQRFCVGSKWRTLFIMTGKTAPERTVTHVQSNGCRFSPAPWSPREGCLDWPKARNITVEDDGAITLSFDDGRPYARYWELNCDGIQTHDLKGE